MPVPLLPRQHLGHYELLEQLGRGGMGVVFRARDLRLHREVALKLILTGRLATDNEVARFRAEADAAARLDHPNIVPIYEVGEENGQHYFSMKLVRGGSLADRLATGTVGKAASAQSKAEAAESTVRHIEPPAISTPTIREGTNSYTAKESAQLVALIARAVHYAHQRGILHRDLKPGNILIDSNGEPLVTDFGLARRLDSNSEITRSGVVVGSPSYMAPEQSRAGPQAVTVAADVYSLGAILYELIAGGPPHRGVTALETMRQVVEEEPMAPWIARRKWRETQSLCPDEFTQGKDGSRNSASSATAKDAPGEMRPGGDLGFRASDLDIIALKCLAKDPGRRYADASALADDLGRWQRGEPILARPAGSTERIWKWMGRHPAWGSLIGVSVAAVIGFMALQHANEGHLKHERDQARHQERRAAASEQKARAEAERAEANAVTARANLYAADIHAAAQHIEAGQTGPALALLLGHDPLPGQEDARGFEWWLLRKRCAGDAALVLNVAADNVHSLAFSADGRWMASGGHRHIQIWDLINWQSIATLPDISDAAQIQDKTQQALALLEREPQKALEGLLTRATLESQIEPSRPDMAHATAALAFAPNGLLLGSAGHDEYVKVWDVKSRRLNFWHGLKRAEIGFLADGSIAMLGESGGKRRGARLIDTGSGKTICELDAEATSMVVSGDGRQIFTTSDRLLGRRWNGSNEVDRVASPMRQRIYGPLVASHDGALLAGLTSRNKESACVWQPTNGMRMVDLASPGSVIQAMAFSPDNRQLAAGLRDSTVRIFDTSTGEELRRLLGHQAEISAVAWARDGRLVSAGKDGTIRVWDLMMNPDEVVLRSKLQRAVRAPDGRHVAAVDQNGLIVIWNIRESDARPLNARRGYLPLAFVADSPSLLVASADKGRPTALEFWNLADGVTVGKTVLEGTGNLYPRLLATPDGQRVILLRKEDALVFDAKSGQQVARCAQLRRQFHGPDASIDTDRFVSRVFPVGAGIWDARQGQMTTTFQFPEGVRPKVLGSSPDHALVITGDTDGLIRIWDANDGHAVRHLTGHGATVESVTVSSDGRTLASCDADRVTKLWSLPTGRELMTLSRDVEFAQLLFLEDSGTLAGFTTTGAVRVWKAR
ncbi:MAG: hypothetical protein QOF48_2946 [Verrucomicrobiota bacterium]